MPGDSEHPVTVGMLQLRIAAAADVARIAEGLSRGRGHVLMLNDYQVANLLSLFRAMGYGSMIGHNPLKVADTGDWVGEIYHMLLGLAIDTKPNLDPDELAERARKWTP